MTLAKTVFVAGGLTAAWELGWWIRRRGLRGSVYNEAHLRALALNRPLVVVGAPDAAITAGYPCGDVTVDLAPTSCPVAMRADITKPLPFADNSVVVFVSCVLEYVVDADAAWSELERISGGQIFVVRVEPWTLTAWLYPGARHRFWAVPGQAYA